MLHNVLERSSPRGHLYVYSFVHCTVSQSRVSGSELVCVSPLVVRRLVCKLCSLSQILLFGSVAYVSRGGPTTMYIHNVYMYMCASMHQCSCCTCSPIQKDTAHWKVSCMCVIWKIGMLLVT